jgi:hypothetical protein
VTPRAPRRWPLFLIGSPAAVAIWSGWVGLGGLCGFGIVHPLPGIAGGFQLNTAITLPIGVEAYGAYALGAWLRLPADAAAPSVRRARDFARRSAIGALALGMAGQVLYHLLAAAHAHRAPWPVVVLVSCLPVVTLGFGAALTHLLRAAIDLLHAAAHPPGVPAPARVPGRAPAPAPGAVPVPGAPVAVPAAKPGGVPVPAPGRVPAPGAAATRLDEHAAAAEQAFAAELAAGTVPTIRQIRARLRCGQDRARQVQARLGALALGAPPAPAKVAEPAGA